MVKEEMFTVAAHRLPHGPRCGGGWHARILGVPHDGMVHVQEMKVDGDGRWRPSMQTTVFVDALRPFAVPELLDMEGIAAAVDEAVAAVG